MATKTYQAESMLQALQMVQKEFGPEAIILSVREYQPSGPLQLWRKPGIELVAMSPDTLTKAEEMAAPKNPVVKPETLLRNRADGQGVEFIEDGVEIEWSEETSQVREKRVESVFPQHSGSGYRNGKPYKTERKWEPRRIEKNKAPAVDRAALFRGEVSTALSETDNAHDQASAGAEREKDQHPAARGAAVDPNELVSEPLKQIRVCLLSQGLDPKIVDQTIASALAALPSYSQGKYRACKDFISEQLNAEIKVKTKQELSRQPIIVLVGTSGSGKTSTTAKLAYYYHKVMEQPVEWVCADTVRTGAIPESRAFADVMGMPLHLVYTKEDMKKVFKNDTSSGVVLVDTPGFNPWNKTQVTELTELLRVIPDGEIYFVASATTKDVDLDQALAALKGTPLAGMVITKLDETMTFGSTYGFARKSSLPVTFYCAGKEADSHLYFADANRLTQAMLGKGWMK
jgi:flagellar biosynthesis protein FlhF